MTRAFLLLTILATLGLASCTDDTQRAVPEDPNARLTNIYAATIRSVVTFERPDLTLDEPIEPVVFVSPREDVEIGLDVQAGVVIALENWATIRFIDEIDEAIDRNEPDGIVRDGGMLIGLGPVPDGTSNVTVGADRYERADEMMVFELQVQRRSGTWSVTNSPEVLVIPLR
ncbi:MAG: hypothetical protein ACXIVQ_17690 [Acidimicrobiales bacterium]